MDRVRPELQEYSRIPDQKTKHRPDFIPSRYVSIQDRVNASTDYEFFYINKLISEGWYRLGKNSDILDDEMKGRHFKYRLNGKSLSGAKKGTFRSGGIVIGKNMDDENYLIYKAYNGCIFPLQISDIQEIYVKNPNDNIEGSKREKVIRKTQIFKQPNVSTPFPVYLPDKNTGNDILIYYAKDNYSRERFKNSKKYKYSLETGDWRFE